KIVPYTKTDAGIREIDLHSDISAFVAGHFGGRGGLLFPSPEGTPRLAGDVGRRAVGTQTKGSHGCYSEDRTRGSRNSKGHEIPCVPTLLHHVASEPAGSG